MAMVVKKTMVHEAAEPFVTSFSRRSLYPTEVKRRSRCHVLDLKNNSSGTGSSPKLIASTQLPLPLQKLKNFYDASKDKSLGYPNGRGLDYAPLFEFFAYNLNNIGDAFVANDYQMQTHCYEKEVIEQFLRWLGGNLQKHWGYTTTGSTEGNFYALRVAREKYPDAIVYYSAEAHYSIPKAVSSLKMTSQKLATRFDGSLSLERWRAVLEKHVKEDKSKPLIWVANIGSTMKGAIDDVKGVLGLFAQYGIERYHVHADAALSGMLLPFVEDPQAFDFQAGVHSIAISGHKFLGTPMPSGVILCQLEDKNRLASPVEYVGCQDVTLSGSRNGHIPLFLWYALFVLGKDDAMKQLVKETLQLAESTEQRLKDRGLLVYRHENSLTLYFPKPSNQIVLSYHLACEGSLAHIIVMPGVGQNTLDDFINDLAKDAKRSF